MTIKLFESRKAFLATALLVVVVLSSVVVAYAEVTVGSVAPLQGTVMYSLDNAEVGTWNTTLAPNGPLAPWYSRLEINGVGYNGPVTIVWKLQQSSGFSSWTDVSGAAMSTSMVLSGSVQSVYATSNGAYSSSNYNWGQNITASGTYRVVVTIMA
jgi:opacity protein-like surface antigen